MGRPHRALTATAMATLVLSALALDPVSNVDVISRCQTILSSTSAATTATQAATFITLPTNQLPSDVAAALATRSLDWAKLSDVMRIGLLWAHGYVVPGGGSGAPAKVYTACDTADALEEPKGRFMDDIALPNDRFAAAKCENNTCGTWFQATNDKCAPAVAADLLCAVDAVPTALPVSNESFWSYTGADSTDEPFPQLYTHALQVTNSTASSAATKTLNVISIHMAASTSGSPRCGNTGVAIVPCLPVADVASKSELKFCRPQVEASALTKFLDTVNKTLAAAAAAPADSTLKTEEKTSGGGLSTGAIIGIAGGALVVLGLLAFYFFRSKQSRRAGAGNDPEYPGFGRKSSNGNGARAGANGGGGNAGGGQGFSANRYRGIQRQGTSNTFPLMDSANDTVISTDYVGGNDGLDEESRQRPFSHRLMESHGSTGHPRTSSVGGSSRGAMYGKSVDEYCEESDIIREFVNDPQVNIRRIPYEDLTILRILSKGSYGEVFLGQLETRHIAMKRLLPEKKHLTKSIEQFMGEIQIMCNLEHRNIVTFVGVSWDYLQNISVIVEYMDNGDLAEVLAKSKNKFSWPKEKISISMDVAEGLVYLHSMRPVIVHRDLKSKNVLLNKRGQAKLSDFGVSRKTTVNETMTSGVGTLLWTAPEIIEGRKYSEKADIFSLGVVLSEIDTCEEPYSTVKNEETGERLPGMQIVQMVRLGELKINFRDDCPPKLRELAQQCTSLDPDKRPTSMEVAYTLKSIIAPSLRASASS